MNILGEILFLWNLNQCFMGLSSNILWHQTNKDGLIKILKSRNFRFSYSKERILDKKLFVAFPMISFCDLPFSEFTDYISKYGGYSIGMHKVWGYVNHFNPVWYCQTGSYVKRIIMDIMTNDLKPEDKATDVMVELLAYMKPNEGQLEVRERKYLNYRFADEREVRLVPPYAWLEKHDMAFMLSEEQYSKYKEEHKSSLLPIGVKYDWSDIKYIVVQNPKNVREIKDLLKKLGCDNDEIQIFSQGQIKEDFIGIEHDIVDTPSNNLKTTTLQFYKKPLDLDEKFTLKA